MRGPRPEPVRARAILGSALAACALAQLATCAALEAAPERARFAELRRMLDELGPDGASEVDVVFLGSSRFGSAVREAAIADELRLETGRRLRVLGADVTAGDLLAVDFVTGTLLERGLRPELAIVELSPETLAARVRWINAHVVRHLRSAELPALAGSISAQGKWSRVAWTRLAPVYWYRKEILEALTGRRGPYLNAPRARPRPSEPGEVLTRDGLRAIERWLRDYRIGDPPAARFERVLARLRDAGARVLVLGVPVHSSHRALYTAGIEAGFRAHVDARMDPPGIEWIDWRGRLDDTDFLDNHHLTEAGAERFSRFAAQELIAPRLPRAGAAP